ncbi:hypothetical protein [Sphingobium sp.]|uniref:hypothetical protein n=1 Tax=Sphingobium sp. TaxID=1912891 RepID=UPI003B3A3E69
MQAVDEPFVDLPPSFLRAKGATLEFRLYIVKIDQTASTCDLTSGQHVIGDDCRRHPPRKNRIDMANRQLVRNPRQSLAAETRREDGPHAQQIDIAPDPFRQGPDDLRSSAPFGNGDQRHALCHRAQRREIHLPDLFVGPRI